MTPLTRADSWKSFHNPWMFGIRFELCVHFLRRKILRYRKQEDRTRDNYDERNSLFYCDEIFPIPGSVWFFYQFKISYTKEYTMTWSFKPLNMCKAPNRRAKKTFSSKCWHCQNLLDLDLLNSQSCDMRQSAEQLYDKWHILGRESHLFALFWNFWAIQAIWGVNLGCKGQTWPLSCLNGKIWWEP